jgi:hypothetical protein
MTGVPATDDRSGALARLRRASDALRGGDVVGHPWDDEEMTAALAEHLLLVAGVLPSTTPSWLTEWHRLARRHGVHIASVTGEPTGGPDVLSDLRARLEQLSDRADQSAARMCCDR